MKINFVLLLLLTLLVNCNKQGHFFYKETEIKKNQIYLFFRETKSKAGMVSKSYNINKSNYSHVAIGGVIDNKVLVYHILNDKYEGKKSRKSDLICEDIKKFYNSPDEEVLSGAIYKVENVTASDFVRFRKILNILKMRNLKFDKKFISADDENFYCSELVYYILKNTKHDIELKLTRKKLTGIDAVLLKRDTIAYYPTDVFVKDKNFILIEQW